MSDALLRTTFIFDTTTTNQWSSESDYVQLTLRARQQYANDLLRVRNRPVFLNDVLDMLGMDRTAQGQLVGWMPGSKIDFGAVEGDDMWTLNFNVDGEVWNELPD